MLIHDHSLNNFHLYRKDITMNQNRFTMSIFESRSNGAFSSSTVDAEDVINVDCSKEIKAVKVAVIRKAPMS